MLYFVIIGLLVTCLVKRNPLQAFRTLRFRAPYLFFGAFLVQLLLAWAVKNNPQHQFPLLLTITFLVMLTGLFINRIIFGVKWIFWGTFLNASAILFHGGSMPVLESAMRVAGVVNKDFSGDSRHFLLNHSLFWWIGDWIPLIRPFGSYYFLSPGDVLVGIGLIIFLVRNSRRSVMAI